MQKARVLFGYEFCHFHHWQYNTWIHDIMGYHWVHVRVEDMVLLTVLYLNEYEYKTFHVWG